jgi:acylaminoacyl-peptidase
MFEEVVTHPDNPDVEGFLWGLKEYQGKELNQRPAFLFLHGGPHSLRHAIYDPAFNILINRGFLIVGVNFSGTWSYGSEFNERINGNLGTKDVDEIVNIVSMLQEDGKLTKTHLNYDGGSYAGFLGFTMFQRYPHLFKNMFIFNPIVNLLHMAFSSDLPEYCWNEGVNCGEPFDYTKDFSDEQILDLKNKSPALKAFDPNSKTKIVLNLGENDQRVYPRAAELLYKKLKNVGVDITCRKYKSELHVFVLAFVNFEIRM